MNYSGAQYPDHKPLVVETIYEEPEEASKAYRQLRLKLRDVDTPCKDRPDRFVDWNAGFEPTEGEAADMCQGCPLIQECRAFAHVAEELHGVWGGEVYVVDTVW